MLLDSNMDASCPFSLTVLQSLSAFDHPDWNLASARQEIDFLEVLDKLIERFSKAEGQNFARTATKLAKIKAHIQPQMVVDAGGSRLEARSGEDTNIGKTWAPIDFFDDQWLGDVWEPMEF
jgi:hypothetical protein